MLKGNQRQLKENSEYPNKRRFVCKFFSNLKATQTLEGVKNQITKDYEASMECEEEVEVHVLEFKRKDLKQTNKKAFTVLVVPKDKSKTITDILKDKYPPTTEYSPNKLMCRPWGGTIPEEIGKFISNNDQGVDDNLMA